MNAVEIEEAVAKLAELPFDAIEFPYQFLEAFGNKPATIKILRSGKSNQSDIPNAVLQRNNIHIATCEIGKVEETLEELRKSPKTATAKAKFILATDGEFFKAEDLNSGDVVATEYANFADKFGFFLPLAGISTVSQIKESAFDIKATGRLNRLYIELLNTNPDWAKKEKRADMNHFMARLIFCFFAEDTDIFNGNGLFTQTVDQMSERDSSNTHSIISEIFRAMNTRTTENGHPTNKYRKEADIRSWADVFPYVNGGLFSGGIDVPIFSKIARSYLISIGKLNWKKINPDIFGSMIQAVADDDERGALGMHYTSVPNILKVLNPLFLDELRAELENAGDSKIKLLNLRKRISKIRVFDPACGSGNFLVIAYKQLRAIEAVINERRGEKDIKTEIPITNFRGIEIKSFSAEIARLALIIAEYQCDVLYRGQKEALAEFLPLNNQNWITCGNALRIDWLSICPPNGNVVKLHGDDLFNTPLDQAEINFENEGGETYICGNPPYKGTSEQTKEMKDDMKWLFDGRIDKFKSLDYVCGWFLKAHDYGLSTPTKSAFVTTNSICQGQHVPILWPHLLKNGFKIFFAHSSFKWKNLASKNAGVTVIIAGITNSNFDKCRLYSINEDGTNIEKSCEFINPYLAPDLKIEIETQSKPISDLTQMDYGSKAADGKFLNFDNDTANKIIRKSANAQKFIYPYCSADDVISGKIRKCLWIEDSEVAEAMALPEIAVLIEGVRDFRSKSTKEATARLAARPHAFAEPRFVKNKLVLIIPRVTSENRNYLPVTTIPVNTVVSDAAFALYDAPLWNMALIASKLHLVWIATVCGQLETRLRYSNTLGWNTFPVPTLTEQNKADLTKCAEDILLAREHYFPATIADMYDPERMDTEFPLVREAHNRNDETLERIYIGRKFKNDTERLEKLFNLYTKMTANKTKVK